MTNQQKHRIEIDWDYPDVHSYSVSCSCGWKSWTPTEHLAEKAGEEHKKRIAESQAIPGYMFATESGTSNERF